jgi:hypothetical protein
VTTVLVVVGVGVGCVVVAGWKVAAVGGGSRSARRRWAAGAAMTSVLLALLSAYLGVLGSGVLYAVVGVWAVWDWWRDRPPRVRRGAFLGAAP